MRFKCKGRMVLIDGEEEVRQRWKKKRQTRVMEQVGWRAEVRGCSDDERKEGGDEA